MTLVKHELKQGKLSFAIWTAAIGLFMAICVFLFPEMKGQMNGIGDLFASMGFFTEAFGMNKINFGEFVGYFGVECGNVLGLGGAFFASLLGISALAKEEKERTAEFLLTHPISRYTIVRQKLCAIFVQIVVFQAVVIGITTLSICIIGETPDRKTLILLFFAYFILQIEIASICFGISAFISRGGLGIGIGIAALFYFLNLIANLTEKAAFLKYITPFGYTESADIITSGRIEMKYLSVGLVFTVISILLAFYRYGKKDIA